LQFTKAMATAKITTVLQ